MTETTAAAPKGTAAQTAPPPSATIGDQGIDPEALAALTLAFDLLDHGVPVVVCRPREGWQPGDKRSDVIPPPGWQTITAAEARPLLEASYRPGAVLAMVGGHGVDVVDVDIKDGGTVANLPPFRSFGLHATPSGGWHYLVRSTGLGKISPLTTSAGHVGDYVGGTPNGGSRMLAFLPGSVRPKYPTSSYRIEQRVDLDELFDCNPDDELVGALVAAGGSREGLPGARAASYTEARAFLAEHDGVESGCAYGRKAVAALLDDARAAVPGDPARGRHAWAVQAVTRVVELIRAGCATSADVRAIAATLDEIKPEGGDDVLGILAWALTNADGGSECVQHTGTVGILPEVDRAAPSPLIDVAQPPVSGPVSADQAAPGAWAPLDLAEVVQGLTTGSLQRPVPTVGVRSDGEALFYRGKVNGVAGASGSGKSWVALLACLQALTAGAHVVYVDYESDAAETVGRLLDLGAPPADIVACFHYLQPDQRLGEDGAAVLAALVQARDVTVVVIDSVGESMAVEGDSPNDDDDTARWFRRFPTMLAKLGPAVIVIDHVTKADDREPGLWPIGSQRKRAAISGAQYMQRTGKPFAQGQPGTARIICAKDRGGNYRQNDHVATLTVTPGGPVLMQLQAPTPRTEDGAARGPFRPTGYMERVSRVLEAAPEPLSQNAVLDLVRGKESVKTAALRTLVAERYVVQSNGPRNSKLHAVARPYREADDPASDSYVGDRETVTGSTTTATVAVSMERETGDGRSVPPGRQSGDGRATVAGPVLFAVGGTP